MDRVDSSFDVALFDLGGVVLEIDFARTFDAWAASAGTSVMKIAERFSFDAPYEAHERGEIDASTYFASLRDALDLPLDDLDFEAGWNALFVRPIPGIGELLQAYARRGPVYAFSNTNAVHERHWRKHYRTCVEAFQRIYVSSTIGFRKPDLAAFQFVTRDIGVAPERALFFDDTQSNVDGARAAGLQAVHVRSIEDVRRCLT
ncbi:MAG: HAD family phosphatase [Gammaproteobacteria bacterium]|nr:HAD family phosphatase [Gammaproteobacteria bacterium]